MASGLEGAIKTTTTKFPLAGETYILWCGTHWTNIKHVVLCVRMGDYAKWKSYYRRFFGFYLYAFCYNYCRHCMGRYRVYMLESY